MPSWNIHTAHAELLLREEGAAALGIRDVDAFLLGNLLPDVYVGEAPVDEGGFGRVADVIFDGFFTDMYMQGRINDQREAVDEMLARVRRLDRELTRMSAQ